MTNTGEPELIRNILQLSVAGIWENKWEQGWTPHRAHASGPAAPQTLLISNDGYQAPVPAWSSLRCSHQLPFVAFRVVGQEESWLESWRVTLDRDRRAWEERKMEGSCKKLQDVPVSDI